MGGGLMHTAMDVAAWVAACLAFRWAKRYVPLPPAAPNRDLTYLAALLFGAGAGAVIFGTANLWLSGQPGVARSIEGAILGGIVAIELYKAVNGIDVRTGARFALSFAVGAAVGRIGCFLAGLDDFTYGMPTSLPWGHDFGDGVMRHPVQLYESAAMAAFALAYVWQIKRSNRFVIDNGFYLAAGFYGLQRFAWEFFKPYAPLVGPFTLFHFLSAVLVVYAIVMIATAPKSRAANDRAFA